MTALHFKEKKISHKGEMPTHWTTERMEHCTSISGKFETDPIKEAKNSFQCTFHDSDGYDMDYIDGERFLEGPFEIPVYGLVFDNGQYYWTGDIASVQFNLTATLSHNNRLDDEETMQSQEEDSYSPHPLDNDLDDR